MNDDAAIAPSIERTGDLKPARVKLTEIFLSIQGETDSVG